MAVSGPKSRDVLAAALDDVDMSNEAFPFMAVRHATLNGVPVLVARLSFSGELAYEVYCGAHYGEAAWVSLLEAGKPFDLQPYGLEALGTLRIEKGHVAGPELDGSTTAEDLGLAAMVSTKKHFIGAAMHQREGLTDPGRLKLVGFASTDGGKIRAGAHLVAAEDTTKPPKSLGHITSVTYSPALEKYIGLGLLQDGPSRIGQKLIATYPLKDVDVAVEVVSSHFFDPEGVRQLA
jgi:methylglutamate dehydrogenase subunit C